MKDSNETRVIYEVARAGGEGTTIVMCEADVEVRAKTVKVVQRRNGAPFCYGDGPCSMHRSTWPTDGCAWTKADAVAQFIGKLADDLVDLRAEIAAIETLIASAQALLVEAE